MVSYNRDDYMKKKINQYLIIASLFLFVLFACCALNTYIQGVLTVNDDEVTLVTNAADKYLTLYKDNDDVKSVLNSEDGQLYLPIEELEAKGLLKRSDIPYLKGVIKVENDNGKYKTSFVKSNEKYITIIYNAYDYKLSKNAEVVYCEGDYYLCLKDKTFPYPTEENVHINSWSLKKGEEGLVGPNAYIGDLIKNKKINQNTIRLYAEVNKKVYLTINSSILGIENTVIECNLKNAESMCASRLPSYQEYPSITYNSNEDFSGYLYYQNETFKYDRNTMLYVNPEMGNLTIRGEKVVSKTNNDYDLVVALSLSSEMNNNNRLGNIKYALPALFNNIKTSKITLVTFNNTISTIKCNSSREVIDNIANYTTQGTANYNNLLYKLDNMLSDEKKTEVVIIGENNGLINKDSLPVDSLKEKANIYVLSIGLNDKNGLKDISDKYYVYDDLVDSYELTTLKNDFSYISNDINNSEKAETIDEVNLEVINGIVEIKYQEGIPVQLYLNDTLVDDITRDLYHKNGTYYFNLNKYAQNNSAINIHNIKDIKIRF